MGMTQIEDTAGNVAEVGQLGPNVELSASSFNTLDIDPAYDSTTVSLVLTPRQARALARQLLAEADAAEYDDEG